MIVEQIQSPWIQPASRPDLDEDPPRLVRLPFAFAVAFFARSSTAVLSFPMVEVRARAEIRRRDASKGGIGRKQRENGGMQNRAPAQHLI